MFPSRMVGTVVERNFSRRNIDILSKTVASLWRWRPDGDIRKMRTAKRRKVILARRWLKSVIKLFKLFRRNLEQFDFLLEFGFLGAVDWAISLFHSDFVVAWR